MYLINKDDNKIERVEKITFKSEGLTERKNLQEWIAQNPRSLGEDLLIIQKEFAGFDNTNERLDLLALDKKGNLVLIENKLDDTGRDVVWQALKYASYCSSLTGQNIKDIYDEYLQQQGSAEKAQRLLEEFFGNEDFEEKFNVGNSQRIMLVAGEFRPEVTSTVMWLLNYGLRVQCFKVTLHKLNEKLLLDVDQIIPIKEAQDYIIKIASKNREENDNKEELENRYTYRFAFWSQFLVESNKHNDYCAGLNPIKESWIRVGVGLTGVSINLVTSMNYARTEVYINRGTATENKRVFDALYAQKEEIEKKFGAPLTWERMEDKVSSRIKWQLDGVNVQDESDYPQMNEFLIDGVERMKRAFADPINSLAR
jgi:hypothetical protein